MSGEKSTCWKRPVKAKTVAFVAVPIVLIAIVVIVVVTTTKKSTTPPGTYVPPDTIPTPLGWTTAKSKAQALVSKLTPAEKGALVSGLGMNNPCLGNIGAVSKIGFSGLCLHDSPTGIRSATGNSAFPAG